MSKRTILAVLDHHASNRTLLETACAYGADWKARLEVILPYPQFWSPDLISVADESAREQIQQIEEHALALEEAIGKRARRDFEDCCAQFEIPIAVEDSPAQPYARWVTVAGFDRGCRTVDHARMADLVFARRPDADTGEGYRNLIGLVLRGSGRPVLMVPPRPRDNGCAHVAIAWNGSAEGVHAVSSALDFIGAACTVDVLTAETDRSTEASADRLVAYLASHDIAAGKHVFHRRGNRSVGEKILDKCNELAADLLVVGANTHNRWREMSFGGVTHHMMNHATLPVLMAQ